MDASPAALASLADLPADARWGMFIADSGQNVLVTSVLLLSLFALWGFCKGMDKHFQKRLCLSLAQSAQMWRAHCLSYLLMVIPAGWLATKLGYKGGMIVGLLMVSIGGFWFHPATQIDGSWALMSKAIAVPLLCFAFVGTDGYLWPRLGGHEGMVGVSTTKGH